MERVVCTSGSSGDCEHFLNFVYNMSCEHIVKNGAGNGCGTSHISKKYQHP